MLILAVRINKQTKPRNPESGTLQKYGNDSDQFPNRPSLLKGPELQATNSLL